MAGIGTAGNVYPGEFDYGEGNRWMYTIRESGGDVTTDLPMLYEGTYLSPAAYTLSNGQYIDWMYTAAYGSDLGYPGIVPEGWGASQ